MLKLKIDNNLKKIFIYSLSGIASIFVSFFSIIIFLKYFSVNEYANYIIQHVFITIGQGVLHLNIGKIASIKLQNLNEITKKKVISLSFYLSVISGIILSTLLFLLFVLASKKFQIIEITFSLFIALIISCIYQTLEDIGKGLGFIKISSFLNWFFFNFSFTVPAFLMIIKPAREIIIAEAFNISLIFKIMGLILFIIYFLKKKKFTLIKPEFKLIKNFFYPSLWLTISAMYSQIFYNLDKYIIKISLGSGQLILYSLPQQISSKLGVISQAVSAVLLPNLSKKNSNKKEIITANLYGVFYFLSFILIFSLPFLDNILFFILKDKYNLLATIILKFFILINLFNCMSNIIIDKYHSELNTIKDLKYLTFAIVPFVLGLIIFGQIKQILYFVFLILLKDFLLLIKRILSAKNLILNYKFLILQIIILTILCVSDTYQIYWAYVLALIIFFLLFLNNSNKGLILDQFYNKNKN
jgi:O-antigen/teichoic acid export membrane protein